MASGGGDQGVSTCHTSLGGMWCWCWFFLLCNPLGVIFPRLLAPFYTSALSSPVCSSRQHPNLLYKLPFTCAGDFFPFFATPKIPLAEVQVSISLTDRRWVVYSWGVYSAKLGPHHLSPHAPTPLHRTLRLCFSRPLKPCQPCISLYCRCVKSQKYLTLPRITASSCYVWKTSIVPHRGKQNEP